MSRTEEVGRSGSDGGEEPRSVRSQRELRRAVVPVLVDGHHSTDDVGVVHDRHRSEPHVVAAVEHLFDTHARQFTDAFQRVPVEERTLDRAIEALWRIVSGSPFAAVLEVVVAARTDDELRAK